MAVTLNCEQCGREFEVPPYRVDKARFCTHECYSRWLSQHKRGRDSDAWRGGNVTVTCEQCGVEFEVAQHRKEQARFCSRRCHGAWKTAHLCGEQVWNWEGGESEFTCHACGATFQRAAAKTKRNTHSFCSKECYWDWHRGENHADWQGGGVNYYGADWWTQRRLARERDGYACRRCGISHEAGERQIDVHHIVPYRESQNNALGNLICLCQRCHAGVECGKFDLPTGQLTDKELGWSG